MKVPKGWQVMRMAEAGEIYGGRQRSPHLTNGTMRPYLRVANVMDGYIDASDVKQMKFTDSEFEKFKLRAGDILLNEGQSLELCGRPALYRGVPPDCCFQNTIIRFRPSPGTHGNFALQLFKFLLASGRFASISSKTTSIAHLGLSRFAGLKAAFPPSEEQPKIASILEACDRGTESQQALLAAKVERKRGLMQQLLTGKTRFKEFKGERWRTHRLGDLLQEVDRYVTFDDDHTYRLASIRRRSEGLFFREALQGNDIKTKVMKTIRAGDFILSKMQVVHGAWGLVTPEFDGMFVSDSYISLVPKDGSPLKIEFLNYLSQMRFLRHLAYICSHGVHIEKMTFNLEDFLHKKITIPPTLDEQAKIVGVLSACDDEIKVLQKQLEALKEQKRGLMQKLLTGEIRVKL